MKKEEDLFPSEQLKKTLEFIPYQDIIEIIADKDKSYSKKQLWNMIKRFYNRRES